MLSIDLKTIFLSYIITTMVSLGLLILFFQRNKKRFAGSTAILSSFAIYALGILLIFLHDFFPNWIPTLIANTLLVAAAGALLIGIEQFIKEKGPQLQNYIFGVLFILVQTYYTYIQPDISIRIINLSLISLVLNTQIAWLTLKKAPITLRPITRSVGIVTIIICVIQITRITTNIFHKPDISTYFQSGEFESWYVLIAQVIFLLLTYSLVLMYNKQLLIDITTQEEKYTKIFRSTSLAVVLSKIENGIICEVNQGFNRLSEYTTDEVIGKRALDLQLWIDEDARNNFVNLVKENDGISEYETVFRQKSGTLIPGLLSSNLISIQNENYLLTVFIDISKRIKSEQESKRLHKQTIELETIINRSPAIAFLWRDEENWQVEYVSENIKIFGYTASQFITGEIAFLNIIHQFDLPIFLKEVEQNRARNKTEFTHEVRIMTASHDIRWIVIHFTIRHDKNTTDYQGIIEDITEFKESTEQIKKLSRAVEQTSATIIITNKFGNIEYTNPKFTRLTGYTFEEVKGKNPRILKSGETSSEEYKTLWKTVRAGNEWTGVFHNKKKNGDLYWEQASISPITNENGVITHYIGVKEDITERKYTQEALKESEAKLMHLNATKDKFFSIIAHDLKAPFNAVVGFSSVLADQIQKKDYDNIEKYAKIIQQSSGRAMDLLTNLMEWARSQTGHMEYNPEHIEIVGLVHNTIDLLNDVAKQKKISIIADLPEKMEIIADKAMLSTVIRNLISNAIKFTFPGGKIEVKVLLQSENIRFSIKDSGVGIDEENLKNLFQIEGKYSTNGTQNEKGTGLGLILCQEFVEKHKGVIYCESEIGKGSTFIFTLPHV